MDSQFPIFNSAITSTSVPNFCDLSSKFNPSFYALGDSFSAGFGANCGWIKDDFDKEGACLKCRGAYPYQIIEVANTSSCMEVYHLGCSGAYMADIVDKGWNGRASQIELLRNSSGEAGWATLSIGGNDVGFEPILAGCLLFDLPSCDDKMDRTEKNIADPKLLERFVFTYEEVLYVAKDPHFTLIVPGYVQFFNADSEYCDDKSLLCGRHLKREFRNRLNSMIVDFNAVIQRAVETVQQRLILAKSRKKIFYEDWDGALENHRFCEEPPNAWDLDAWFFTIGGPDILPNGTMVPSTRDSVDQTSFCWDERTSHGNTAVLLLRDWAIKVGNGEDVDWNAATLPGLWPVWIKKVLHPKSIAHRELGRRIYEKWMNGGYFTD